MSKTTIKTFTVADVEKRFSDIITNYLNEGWIVNAQTMGGTQGEKARINLRSKDNKIIRNIFLTRETIYTSRLNSSDELVIYVEDFENYKEGYDQICSNNLISGWSTIWNGNGKQILKEEYICIKSAWSYRSNAEVKFTDREGFEYISKIREDKCLAKKSEKEDLLSEELFPIILPFLRRQPKCKTKKISDILMVRKLQNNGLSYYITTKNHKCYELTAKV